MKCKTCGQEVGMLGAMAHMMGMHGGKSQYSCKACGMRFSSQQELMDHSKKAHKM